MLVGGNGMSATPGGLNWGMTKGAEEPMVLQLTAAGQAELAAAIVELCDEAWLTTNHHSYADAKVRVEELLGRKLEAT